MLIEASFIIIKKMRTTQSTNGHMDKQIVMYSCSGIYSVMRKGTTATHNNMDETHNTVMNVRIQGQSPYSLVSCIHISFNTGKTIHAGRSQGPGYPQVGL